jgi:hypothetical protein
VLIRIIIIICWIIKVRYLTGISYEIHKVTWWHATVAYLPPFMRQKPNDGSYVAAAAYKTISRGTVTLPFQYFLRWKLNGGIICDPIFMTWSSWSTDEIRKFFASVNCIIHRSCEICCWRSLFSIGSSRFKLINTFNQSGNQFIINRC